MPFVCYLHPQGGKLIERRLHQRKWKWIIHGSPKHQFLTSITPVSQDELMEKSHSLFLTTETGIVFEYQIPKNPGEFIPNAISSTIIYKIGLYETVWTKGSILF